MVLSCLHYANLLLFGCSLSNMAKLERTQNTAVCVVLDTWRPCAAQQFLCYLHWQPVHFCINYKIATLTNKVLTYNICIWSS